MPGIQSGNKAFLAGHTEVFCKHFQFPACLELRVSRQITGDDLLLMEVAHLDGDIAKDLSDPWSSIKNNCPESISLSSPMQSFPVDISRLIRRVLPVYRCSSSDGVLLLHRVPELLPKKVTSAITTTG